MSDPQNTQKTTDGDGVDLDELAEVGSRVEAGASRLDDYEVIDAAWEELKRSREKLVMLDLVKGQLSGCEADFTDAQIEYAPDACVRILENLACIYAGQAARAEKRSMYLAPKARAIGFWCERDGEMQFCQAVHASVYWSRCTDLSKIDVWIVSTPGRTSYHPASEIDGWYELPPKPEGASE